MEHTDLILALDKQQQNPSHPYRVVCPADKEHGAMLPMRDGNTLLCCKCGAREHARLASADE